MITFVKAPAVVKRDEVTYTVKCTRATCRLSVTLTAVEHVGRTRRTKTVVVGSSSATIRPGSKLATTLSLNATGRALLAKARSLGLTLTFSQRGAGGRTRVIRTAHVTVRPASTARRG